MATDRTGIKSKLKAMKLGVPTWGLADSGTRFHVYHRPSSPRTLEEKLRDAAQVHSYTGVTPMVDLHTAWDSADDWGAIRTLAGDLGLRIGAVNPHLFDDDDYTLGSFANPSERVRKKSIEKTLQAVDIAKQVGSKVMSMWFADGTDYPGQDDFRKRHHYMLDGLRTVYEAMDADMSMVLEYKFFEPNFYSMDISSWGTSYLLTTRIGERARVLVDLGHHALGVNIEQIVALLLDEDRLGGFHFNDHRYGDDDLTVGSVNPYQLFLIFCELAKAEIEPNLRGRVERAALMIDENHNFKNAIEGTIQSVEAIQIAYARALLVDYDFLRTQQARGEVIQAEECVKDAYLTDVRPLLREVRGELGVDPEPLEAFRRSGYTAKAENTRRSG